MPDSSIDSFDSSAGKPEDSTARKPVDLSWNARDTGWMLNLFGTAIGAGVLYLPINAGAGGIWPLIVLSIIAVPMVWLAHRNLVRFCLSASDPQANITSTVREHFGENAGQVLTVAYFLSIYPILLLYGIGITNVVNSFMEHQLDVEPLPRIWLSLFLVVGLVSVMYTGEKWMLRFVKAMVYPLVAILCCISLYMIPRWNLAIFDYPVTAPDMALTLFITTPLLIFSFNHSPACSAFAQTYKLQYGDSVDCAKKTSKILTRNTQLLFMVIMLFVFSCVLSLTPEELAQAKAENVPVLSVLASTSDNPIFSIVAPLIAFLAIASSYFGVYLGTVEGFQGLITQQWLRYRPSKPLRSVALRRCSVLFLVFTCWGTAYANWSVIGMVEMLVVPVLATILYLMPVYGLYKVEKLKPYRNLWLDIFIVSVGLIAITGFLVDKLI